MKNLIKVDSLTAYELKEGLTVETATSDFGGVKYFNIDSLKSYTEIGKKAKKVKAEKPAAQHEEITLTPGETSEVTPPELDNLELPAAAAAAETLKETPAPTEIKPRAIPGYARYEISSTGVISNVNTGSAIAQEERGGIMKARLTNDKGGRDWVDCGKLYKDLFQPEVITQKPKKAPAEPKGELTLSKSQRIGLMHKAGRTIAEILASDPEFNAGHVRNSIKDYTEHPEKLKKAIELQTKINERKNG